ncbi:transcription factor IIA subunit alpha [Ophidiomyces ophidiicola]|uniref:Transcription factor IIA subunit alpha n=1 Tax=Ophidiomyces ophidiicola TaxID=1387563 RepID=A0ACB8V591_9EURO|nr:transcription factor IIA subunit alpha [Ophidiomyces ophidiicola]KAI1955733.1 transcription factor IIA subunit alpha [Ophidiomyces ophidiicola]KAI1976029.1 transcription factor IIA subunit alpha [Ophidiomyces ophidiicola]KAI2011324.1 transcription factor IIA subunit alpha [Ophidiomyces ophidiicola]KAI2022653.1 transcription factor IIA subunit alpha [Ophidiomyces ophidiicola]
MSNQLVPPFWVRRGVVFDRVIQDVCDSSQIDFEEGGVDQQTLEDLRQGWQKKLSSLGVAHFPWDPHPQPPPSAPQQSSIPPPPVTVPSNAPRPSPSPTAPQYQEQVPPQPTPSPGVGSGQMISDIRVKSEPGYIPGPQTAATIAQQRAASALQQRYGAAAANQIHQLQAQSQAALSLPGQQRPGPLPQHQQQPIGNSQTDGSSDSGNDALAEWKREVSRRREAAKENGTEADRLMRDFVKLRGLQMEGNGLLAPLKDRYPRASGTKRRAAPKAGRNIPGLTAIPEARAPTQPVGYDGVDDFGIKRDEDEDAINSDLDDPEDLIDDDPEGDDAVGQVMLCTYDKVQRVKSKWKCTLKDGILTTEGREYVFHKATGEFEWY